uniref:Uncharacterized protein n=1 Tax=Melopsittacus undulatus TaxID=13146 RepID=A0A8V5GE88_MELUD
MPDLHPPCFALWQSCRLAAARCLSLRQQPHLLRGKAFVAILFIRPPLSIPAFLKEAPVGASPSACGKCSMGRNAFLCPFPPDHNTTEVRGGLQKPRLFQAAHCFAGESQPVPVSAGCCHTHSLSAASLSCLLVFCMVLIHSS